jgi:hypothetical protein
MDNEFDPGPTDELMQKLADTYAEVSKRKEQDIQLLNAFKKSPSKETFTPLYQAFKPWIMKASRPNTFGSPLPASAHWALATQSFLDSIRTFKPELGNFHSHAFTTINNKGKRLNLKYQNIGYIPEARATKYQIFKNSTNLLREQLGREPSTHEIADDMGWSPKMVETMRKEIRDDLVLDEGYSDLQSVIKSDKAMQAFRDMQYSLIPAHQLVMEHALGIGRPALTKPSGGPDLQAISKATKLSVPKIRSALKTISRKYKQHEGFVMNPKDEISEEETE